MEQITDSHILDDICHSIRAIFGWNIHHTMAIPLGYKNLKWRIFTDHGSYFVKQYNRTRYPSSSIAGLEQSLRLQDSLFQNGIPCPRLYPSQQHYVLTSKLGQRFVVMEDLDGSLIEPGTIHPSQAYSLGLTIGQMHQLLFETAPVRQTLHWNLPTKTEMLQNWRKRWEEAKSLACDQTMKQLEVQQKIIDGLEWDLFSSCEKGWAHWDLFVDNILFHSDSVAALLDFDRMHYVYPEFDISRAVLSCCLLNNKLDMTCTTAFISGYRQYRNLSHSKLVRSMKLTWWKESSWLQVAKTTDSRPMIRFREEMIWLANQWDELEDVFDV